ncbi:hypothetical protein GCG54_00009557 [Colletotrichum gloeosporioides]|uniref:Uncharacterized protein n=1 Tax=Colletotrichum gloeosporioides TaxID=474922 RepID=A0A8H4FGG7_COLGL|nr:uncharacterized protein GCG54_00009557 [Colletotrichum gloeosporioides]KAF3800886.1 hypothetical protein GCG54_00009557 [Colletotrichum gloeosporioides]
MVWENLDSWAQFGLGALLIIVGLFYMTFLVVCGFAVGGLLESTNTVVLQYVTGWLLLVVGWTCLILPCIAYYFAAVGLFIVGIIPATIFKATCIRLYTSESFIHNITPRNVLSAIGEVPEVIWTYWLYFSMWLVGGDWEEMKAKWEATESQDETHSNKLENMNGQATGTANTC